MLNSDEPAPLRAIFLAAGFATRLYPLTRDRAKPLLEVGGEPLLTRLVRQVEATQLVWDAIVVTNGRFAADFRAWREQLTTELDVAVVDDGAQNDEEKLGAIADLALALERPAPADIAGYVVLAADNLFDFDLRPVFERFCRKRVAQLLVRQVPDPVPPGRYSEVRLDERNRITSFREKPANPSSNLSAIGAYVFGSDLPQLVADYLAAGNNPDAPGYLLEALARTQPLEATRLEGTWFDIGSKAELERARTALG